MAHVNNYFCLETNFVLAADWNKRLKALKRLQGLIIGGACHIGNFPTLMSRLYVHISSQVEYEWIILSLFFSLTT